MDVEMNAADIMLAAHHAGVIEGVKSLQLARGDVKNNRISNQADFAIHYAGMLGEIAVSKALNIPIRTDITQGGDSGLDMTYMGQSIQIKTSTHQTTPVPRLMIFNSMDDFATDWAVLCSIQAVCLVRIHGFISKRKFKLKVVTHDFGYGERFCVAEEHLTHIQRLPEALKHGQTG